MTEHPSLEVPKKKERRASQPTVKHMSYDLRKVESQLDELKELTENARFPVAFLDATKVENIIRSMSQSYNRLIREMMGIFEKLEKTRKKPEIKEIQSGLQQTNERFQQILNVLGKIAKSLESQEANTALEREVLTKLRDALGR